MTNSEQKEWLLMCINLALGSAPDIKTQNINNVVGNWVEKVLLSGHSLKRWEGIKNTPCSTYFDEVVRFEAKQKNNAVKKLLSKEIGYLTFNIPNSTKFKVLNTKAHLEGFKKKVLKNPGFKNPKKQSKKTYSLRTIKSCINNFIRDGETDNAIQAAELHNVKLGYGIDKHHNPLVYCDVESIDVVKNR